MASPSTPTVPKPRAARKGVKTTLAKSILIISPGAGSMTPEIEKQLRKAFADGLVVEFNPTEDFRELITADARVVVAGGDGTIGYVARALIDSHNTLGIISMGTYNNFAKALGMPATVTAAINVIQKGVPHQITVGRVNGEPFLEAAAIGMFGAAIELGEAIKDWSFGELGRKLSIVTGARRFRYEITGDLKGHGMAMSLVFANTPSIGAALPVAQKTPIDRFLELAVHAGATRSDIVGRILSGKILSHKDHPVEMGFRFREVTITTKPQMEVFADNLKVGKTPATITAEVGALNILLQKKVAQPRAR